MISTDFKSKLLQQKKIVFGFDQSGFFKFLLDKNVLANKNHLKPTEIRE